jgi:hypothetical protein
MRRRLREATGFAPNRLSSRWIRVPAPFVGKVSLGELMDTVYGDCTPIPAGPGFPRAAPSTLMIKRGPGSAGSTRTSGCLRSA